MGYDFLPRGTGIVTWRPLEIRLVHTTDPNEPPYAVFDKIKNEKFTDFNVITKKVVELTDQDAGLRKGIIEDPIILTMYSNKMPDLSLVDLPGITKIPLRGSDHPDNIEEITVNLCQKYIQDSWTIILCVVMASVDITTSDAIKIAKKFDPNGERTLCALTKADLVSKG